MSNKTIQRPLPSAGHDQRGAHGNDQHMIFEALTLLLPEPVHEKSLRLMHGRDCADHDHDKTRGREPGQEPRDQSETAERLPDNDEKRHEPGQSHLLREESHRLFESIPTKHPKSFWAPCANITLPSPTRRIRPAQESSVLKNDMTYLLSPLVSTTYE